MISIGDKKNIPVFPLSGAILLPNANLPLNIFEERYIEMIDYALSKEKVIGMIQPLENSNELYKVGCLGKITSYNETEDGRYIINLLGKMRFKTIEEIDTPSKFRIFKVEHNQESEKYFDINTENFDKKIVIEKLKLFFKNTKNKMNLNSVEDIDPGDLVKMIAMACPFKINEKQMLLETKNVNDLAKNLLDLFDSYASNNNLSNTFN